MIQIGVHDERKNILGLLQGPMHVIHFTPQRITHSKNMHVGTHVYRIWQLSVGVMEGREGGRGG